MSKFKIEPRDNEFLVLDASGKVVGAHAIEANATAQVEAMDAMANEQLFKLNNVHIFNVGTWNGRKYTEADLDAIVASFDSMGFRPPVKLGHGDDDSAPAFGWIERVYRVGEALMADFVDLPETVFNAIKDRRYDTVSSEIYHGLKRGGQTFTKALKAVALLGSAIPAVNLRPLRESFTFDNAGECHAFTLKNEDLKMGKNTPQLKPEDFEFKDLTGAKEVVANLIAKFNEMAKDGITPDPSFMSQFDKLSKTLDSTSTELEKMKAQRREELVEAKAALLRVPAYRPFITELYKVVTLEAHEGTTVKFKEGEKETEITLIEVLDKLVAQLNADTEKLFQTLTVDTNNSLIPEGYDTEADPGAELDRLAKKHMSENKSTDYMASFNAVCEANPELKSAYAAKQTAE